MTKKRLNSLIKHSRTRSGCLTCRDRHMKCDEQQPVCRNCIKSKRKCYRGVRLNFTQYTIYNPEESTKSLPLPTQNFRILDQSITIASLYENGKRSYEPYLHLHNPQDLQESDFHYQEGIYPAFTPRSQSVSHPQVSNTLEISPSSRNEIMPSSIPISNIVPNHSVPSDNVSPIQGRIPFDHNNIILENFDITNLLLNDLYFIHQYFQNSPSNPDATVNTAPASDPNLPPYSNPQSQMISSNFNVPYLSPSISRNPTAHSKVYFWDEIDFPKSINIESYTLLIDKEKYYRFLDLFNELDVWKSMIPSYCLFDFINFENTLLLDCLLNCSEKSQINLSDLLNRQLFYWVNCRSSPVDTPQKVKPFEDLLVSIALILLSIQRKVGKYNLQDIHVVLINQIKIYNKILVKLQDYLKSKLPKSVILISAIHSIVILKFFIIKSYDIEIDFDYINSTDNSIVLEDKQLENKVNLNGEFNNPDNTKDSGTNFYPRFNFLPEDIEEVILYSDPTKINLYQLNEFEIILLNDLFKNLDYQQQNHQYKLDSHLKSDASKLRDHTWLVIRENYMRFNSSNSDSSFSSSHSRNIALPAFLDNNVILPNLHRAESTSRSPVTKLKDQAEEGSLRWSTSDETPISRISSTSSLPGKSGSEAGSTNVSVKAVLPNQRGIAMNLLREYINKLENEENEEIINNCNFKIESIFKLIYESTMDATIKRHWHRDFRWLLNPNFASAYASVDNRKRSPS